MYAAVSFLIAGCIACAAGASNLFVSSYGSQVYSLSFNNGSDSKSLLVQDANSGCSPSPAWLTFDRDARILYCLDEGILRNNGSLSSYTVSQNGFLTLTERKLIPSGPSASVVYGHDSVERLGISFYNGSALAIVNITSSGILNPAQEFFFRQDKIGATTAQTAPHEHQILLDPSGQYLVLNAWGEDEIQVFSLGPSGAVNATLQSSKAIPGSAPRHGTFWSFNGLNDTSELYYFLLGELSSGLDTYKVKYNTSGPGMTFDLIASTNTYGGGPVPYGNGPAEIQVSPDNRFVVVSNRNTSTTRHKSLDRPLSAIEEFWDNLANFEPQRNGTLVFRGLIPSGGGFPRNFAFNGKGDQVAVTLGAQQRVVVFDRDVATGEFGAIVANATVDGETTCVVWDE